MAAVRSRGELGEATLGGGEQLGAKVDELNDRKGCPKCGYRGEQDGGVLIVNFDEDAELMSWLLSPTPLDLPCENCDLTTTSNR